MPASSWVSTSRATSSGSSRSHRPPLDHERQHHPGEPLGGLDGVDVASAAGLGGDVLDEGVPEDGDDERSRLLELGQEPAGFGGEQVLEHRVVGQRLVSEQQAVDQPGAEVGGVVHRLGQPAEESAHLPRHGLVDQLLPAAGEPPVDAGPTDAGLPGDLVHGDALQAHPSGAGDDGGEDLVALLSRGHGVAGGSGSR